MVRRAESKDDDIEAVKSICDILSGFNQTTQERILRWTLERAGVVLILTKHVRTRGE